MHAWRQPQLCEAYWPCFCALWLAGVCEHACYFLALPFCTNIPVYLQIPYALLYAICRVRLCFFFQLGALCTIFFCD